MLYDRASFAVRHATNRDDTRYALGCIQLLPDGSTVGTDGRWAMVVSPAPEQDDGFPEVNGGGTSPPDDGVLVPLELVDDVLKAIPKKTPKPILKHAQLLRADGEMVEFGTTDLDHVKREGCRVDHLGRFPNVADVVPGRNRTYRISFSVAVLQKALKGLAEFFKQTDSDTDFIEFTFGSEEQCALIRARAADGRQALVPVMPSGVPQDGREREQVLRQAGPIGVTDWEKRFGVTEAVAIAPDDETADEAEPVAAA